MSKLFRRPDSEVWYVRLPKPGGGTRKLSTGCTTKRAAEARVAELEREAVDPAYATSRTTIQQILDDFYRSRVRLGRAEGSLHHVRVKSGQLLRLLPRLARDVTHAVLTRYQDQRASEGVRPTTVAKELRVFGAAWKLARRNRLVIAPLDEIMPETNDDYRPRSRALSPWELVALAVQLPPHRMAVVAFSVASGCEYGALWRAQAGDVAADLTAVRVRGTKRETRDRTAPVHLDTQRTLLAYALPHLPFARWSNMRDDLREACQRAGIAHVSPNDLRRTYGTWLREAGVAPNLIGAAMGHADSKMVERVYGRLTPDALGAAIAGSLMGRAPVASRDLPALGAHQKAAIPSENRCAGTESNRRHGDFQSTTPEVDDALVITGKSAFAEPAKNTPWDANGSLIRRAHAALYGDFAGRALEVRA